ncbi:hypothetical protein AB1N83_012686 [Pleurotus pulmonarius]|nr:hypothetical protein EYR38_007340 [Pleurotus pulmonarius]
MRILERIAAREDKGKEEYLRPKKKRREHPPCQPPTIREGTSVNKLSIEWTVEQKTVWEGEQQREIAQIKSDYAEQVEGSSPSTNPHWTSSKPPPPTSGNLSCKYPITLAAFPNVSLSGAAILGNVRGEVADELRKHPEKYMALIPLGAGNRAFENARELTTAAADLVNEIASDGKQYMVAAPVREGQPPHEARFAKPFAMILRDPTTELRQTLLSARTIAYRRCGKGLAFIVSEISPAEKPWVICNFRGGPVTNSLPRMAEALRAIGEQVVASAGLRALANRILKDENVGRNAEERIHVAIANLSLIFIERLNGSSQSDPVWQLHGKPLTKTDKTHREWLRAMRQVTFFINTTTELTQERAQVKDWLGPLVPPDRLEPEPRDTKSSKEGKRGPKKGRKGKGKA